MIQCNYRRKPKLYLYWIALSVLNCSVKKGPFLNAIVSSLVGCYTGSSPFSSNILKTTSTIWSCNLTPDTRCATRLNVSKRNAQACTLGKFRHFSNYEHEYNDRKLRRMLGIVRDARKKLFRWNDKLFIQSSKTKWNNFWHRLNFILRMAFRQNFFLQDWFKNKLGVGLG